MVLLGVGVQVWPWGAGVAGLLYTPKESLFRYIMYMGFKMEAKRKQDSEGSFQASQLRVTAHLVV